MSLLLLFIGRVILAIELGDQALATARVTDEDWLTAGACAQRMVQATVDQETLAVVAMHGDLATPRRAHERVIGGGA